jgi:hypothetical protein
LKKIVLRWWKVNGDDVVMWCGWVEFWWSGGFEEEEEDAPLLFLFLVFEFFVLRIPLLVCYWSYPFMLLCSFQIRKEIDCQWWTFPFDFSWYVPSCVWLYKECTIWAGIECVELCMTVLWANLVLDWIDFGPKWRKEKKQ